MKPLNYWHLFIKHLMQQSCNKLNEGGSISIKQNDVGYSQLQINSIFQTLTIDIWMRV